MRLILVAEGIQELGRDQKKNRCNRSLNIPNSSDSSQGITQGGEDWSQCAALNRCGANIFLSIRDGNTATNMPLFPPGNPEEASRLIQVCPCLLPCSPDELEHRGVSCVPISPTLVQPVSLLPSQWNYWPGLGKSWVEGEKGKLQQLTSEKLSGTSASNLGSGLPTLKVQTHGRHQELLISAAALTEGTFPK